MALESNALDKKEEVVETKKDYYFVKDEKGRLAVKKIRKNKPEVTITVEDIPAEEAILIRPKKKKVKK